MPRKAKEEQEVKEEAPITEKIGDAVSAVAGKVTGAVATAGEIVSGPVSAVGEKAGDVVAAVTGRGVSGEANEGEEEEAPLQENEALPAVVALKGEAAPAIALPEYVKGRRIEMGRVVSDKMQKTVVVLVERSK